MEIWVSVVDGCGYDIVELYASRLLAEDDHAERIKELLPDEHWAEHYEGLTCYEQIERYHEEAGKLHTEEYALSCEYYISLYSKKVIGA